MAQEPKPVDAEEVVPAKSSQKKIIIIVVAALLFVIGLIVLVNLVVAK